MKVTFFNPKHLPNETHLVFYQEFCALAERCGIDKMKIDALFVTFPVLLADEDRAIKKIRKSARTAKMKALDKKRDKTWRGMTNALISALDHYDSAMREAATTLQIVFKTYGNVAKQSLDSETGSIYNFLQDMRGKYAAEAAKVGLNGWLDALEKINSEFIELKAERTDEISELVPFSAGEVRRKIDRVYIDIIERINAGILMEGKENYSEFVTKHNVEIKRYMDILAQKKGRAAAKKAKAEDDGE